MAFEIYRRKVDPNAMTDVISYIKVLLEKTKLQIIESSCRSENGCYSYKIKYADFNCEATNISKISAKKLAYEKLLLEIQNKNIANPTPPEELVSSAIARCTHHRNLL